MAHFAKINEDGIVEQVIVISNEDAPDPAPENSESIGQQFIASLGIDGTWIQTSYNHNFRKQFAGNGYKYNLEKDIFIAPQPCKGWILNENNDWVPPIPKPDENEWYWDEKELTWKQPNI